MMHQHAKTVRGLTLKSNPRSTNRKAIQNLEYSNFGGCPKRSGSRSYRTLTPKSELSSSSPFPIRYNFLSGSPFSVIIECFRHSLSMKFLEYTPLERLNDFFSHLNLGERTIKGCLEAYSCKHTGSDKKLSLSLENEILDYLGKSSDSDSSSPAEFLLTRSSRKTLIYLVLTLYHLYPDYDFSAVNAHQFFTEESWDSFKQIFDTYMFEASKEWTETNEGSSLLEALYKALDEVVRLAECEVYSYIPDSDADPFLERGSIWSFNFFFYNRKLKRVVSFRVCCLSNLVADGYRMDELRYDEDGEIFDNMDI